MSYFLHLLLMLLLMIHFFCIVRKEGLLNLKIWALLLLWLTGEVFRVVLYMKYEVNSWFLDFYIFRSKKGKGNRRGTPTIFSSNMSNFGNS
jgi:TctA family transporter